MTDPRGIFLKNDNHRITSEPATLANLLKDCRVSDHVWRTNYLGGWIPYSWHDEHRIKPPNPYTPFGSTIEGEYRKKLEERIRANNPLHNMTYHQPKDETLNKSRLIIPINDETAFVITEEESNSVFTGEKAPRIRYQKFGLVEDTLINADGEETVSLRVTEPITSAIRMDVEDAEALVKALTKGIDRIRAAATEE